MIAIIVPAVTSTPPAAPQRTAGSDDADFAKTLDEKQQPQDKNSLPAQVPPADGKAAAPRPDGEEKKAEGDDASEAVQPAIAVIPLAESAAPAVENAPAAAEDTAVNDDRQIRLQHLVMQAATGAEAPAADSSGNASAQASALAWSMPGLSAVSAAGRLEPTGPGKPEPHLARTPATDDGRSAADGEESSASSVNGKETASAESSATPMKPQPQESAPLSQSSESRFSPLPGGDARPAISVAHQREAAPALQLTPPSGNSLNPPVGTPAWQQALSQQLSWFTRNGIHNAELRLHPEELGSLQISLRLNNDRAQLHFVTENHQVRAALESAMPHLRTSLAESGIELGHSSVGHESPSSWQELFNSGRSPGRGFGEDDTHEGHIMAEEVSSVVIESRALTNGINTFI